MSHSKTPGETADFRSDSRRLLGSLVRNKKMGDAGIIPNGSGNADPASLLNTNDDLAECTTIEMLISLERIAEGIHGIDDRANPGLL